MDLDNIKKTWQQTEIKPTINDEKIQRMLDSRGKNSLESLMTYEKWGMIIGLACIPISFVLQNKYLIIIFLTGAICSEIWQIYKYRFLKRINLSTMSILDVSNAMIKYKKYIFREFIGGTIWAILFMGSLMYIQMFHDLLLNHPEKTKTFAFLMVLSIAIGFIALTLSTIYILYRYTYIQNIKQIEKSIEEIKDFEQGND